MLDAAAIRFLKPALQAVAQRLVRAGVGADAVTGLAFAIGLCAAAAIAVGAFLAGLILILLSRLLDGLDGAVARQTKTTDRGAFFDISLDMLFYASIPLAFAIAQPLANALPAAFLLAAFMGTGTSFLAFAAVAEKRGLKSSDFAQKGIYYLGGLTEATETLLCFALMCGWPQHFALWAYGFALMCGFTVCTRLWGAWRLLQV
jgi:phosphatidylglycerophosphate synthase